MKTIGSIIALLFTGFYLMLFFAACPRGDVFEPEGDTASLTDFGTGYDGILEVSSSIVVNPSTRAINPSKGKSYIEVENQMIFNEGDEILIYIGRGNEAGTYEFNHVKKVANGVIFLDHQLVKEYPTDNLAFVYRVPNYFRVVVKNGGKITCDPWDAVSGKGIVVFRALMSIKTEGTGSIDVSRMGYRGRNRQIDNSAGLQGEGYLGGGSQGTTGAFGNAGGGTVSPSASTTAGGGGGGGGYGTPGQAGQDAINGIDGGTGGNEVGDPSLSKMFFGGSGGTGDDNDSLAAVDPNSGHGGGIMLLVSPVIDIDNVYANGGDAQSCAGVPITTVGREAVQVAPFS